MRHSTILLPVLIILIAISLPLPGHANETPAAIDGVSIIDANGLKKLQTEGTTVIDARIAAEYAEAHIKGAISIPYHEQSEKNVNYNADRDDFNLSKLPIDKSAAIIFYCNGPTCWKSYKSVLAAKKAGYTNIFWYRDGFSDWKEKGLPIE